MKQYINYSKSEQTKRAYNLGAPIYSAGCGVYEKVTTQQMIGWLIEREIYIHVLPVGSKENNTFKIDVVVVDNKGNIIFSEWHDALVTAEHVAIDAALDYLEKGEIK